MVSFTLVVAYVALSLVIGWWNKWKGHGFLLGFMFSVLLTPILGLLSVALTSPVKFVQTATGLKRTCPRCFDLTAVHSHFCDSCGRDVKQQTVKDFLHLGELFVGLAFTVIIIRMLMQGGS